MELAELSVADGSLKPFGKSGWYEIKQIEWLPDKSALVVMGAEKAGEFSD